jgi:hypothetical protein
MIEAERYDQFLDKLVNYSEQCHRMAEVGNFSLTDACLNIFKTINKHNDLALDELKDDLAKINASIAKGPGTIG